MEEVHGASAAPSQLISCYSYQNRPKLEATCQTTGHNPHGNENSQKQEV